MLPGPMVKQRLNPSALTLVFNPSIIRMMRWIEESRRHTDGLRYYKVKLNHILMIPTSIPIFVHQKDRG